MVILWSVVAKQSFQQLQQALCTYPVLHMPLSNHPFVVYMDTSNVGLGDVLTRKTPQDERRFFFLVGNKYLLFKKRPLL